ncbi:hypothetical protein [Helicobacter pylori]|uniref:hypothetical protein n=1 Tax=Helicobacter pylori TaxID=210 RepID=UPI00026A55C9|nr:hypothetical protein [Helicobacter pylori]EJB48135.1 hypothetical protein HPHPA20_0906 [Helicobacter pylori Hp A-20]OPG37380.1 hypothetical protein BGL64_00185 [Helicobacter pylori]
MENTDNWNECFMPVVSSENNNESFFSKLKLVGSIELLMIYLKNEGYIVSSDPKKIIILIYLHLKFFTMKVSHQKQKNFYCQKLSFR